MDKIYILVFIATAVLILLGILGYILVGNGSRAGGKNSEFRRLMGGETLGIDAPINPRDPITGKREIKVLDAETFRRKSKKMKGKKKEDDINSKLFKAGFYSSKDRAAFNVKRIIIFVFSFVIITFGAHFILKNPPVTLAFAIAGAFIGYAVPISLLEREIRAREDDIMYFLPLVIEQVSIGVSSSLDVGPCITQIIQMAEERDSHNPVTEMFVSVDKLIRSGLNLEDALIEVSEANGVTEVKHAFLFLAQCAKHGGELTKQLQELADSVSIQRQVRIEGKIAALPVKATGPLTVVFAGFFGLIMSGLLVRLMGAFK